MRLTKEEKTVLVSIAAAAVAGLVITFAFSYGKKLSENPVIKAPVMININSATAGELDRLPGVGAVIAGRIIEHRQKNGGFKSIEELSKVKGISKAKLEKMRKLITL